MEIRYEQFYKWHNKAFDMPLELHKVGFFEVLEKHLDTYGNGIKPKLTDEENEIIGKADSLMSGFNGVEIIMEIEEEIDLNFSNIATIDNIKRYASYINKKIDVCIDYFKDTVYHDYLTQTAEIFHSHIGEIREIGPGFKETMKPHKYLDNDPITTFLHSVHMTINCLETISDYIKDELSKLLPLEEANSIQNLTVDRHKLVLLDETGALEFIRNKYLNPSAPLMNLEGFKKLIENIIGARTKDIGSDVGKILSENADPKKSQTIRNSKALSAVKGFLASISLHV